MAIYSIKDLEKLSGIKAHTIRIWEKRYNLIEPHRTNTNIRCYTDWDLKKILNVSVLNRHGIKISNIAKLNEVELREEIMRVAELNPSSDTLIDALVIAMIELDERKFLSIVNKHIAGNGFTNSMTDLLYPFLHKTGVLWQTGDVNPSQEHFISNLIRLKILAATDNLSTVFNPKASKFLLFLPEGEWHEHGLLFAQYLIKEAGHEVIYLGQSVPYSDVLATGAVKEPDHILVSCTTAQPEFDFIRYLQDLGGAYPDKKIIFSSNFLGQNVAGFTDNHIQIHHINEFIAYLKSLEESD